MKTSPDIMMMSRAMMVIQVNNVCPLADHSTVRMFRNVNATATYITIQYLSNDKIMTMSFTS